MRIFSHLGRLFAIGYDPTSRRELGPPYCAACGADLFVRGGLYEPCTNPGAL